MQVAYEQGGAAALRPYIRTLRTLNRRFKDVAPSFIKLAAKHYRERGNKMPQDWSPFGGAF